MVLLLWFENCLDGDRMLPFQAQLMLGALCAICIQAVSLEHFILEQKKSPPPWRGLGWGSNKMVSLKISFFVIYSVVLISCSVAPCFKCFL